MALAHVSNALGTVHPIAELIKSAHAVDAWFLVDGAQATAHQRIDVQALDAGAIYVFDHDERLAVEPWEGAATAIWVGRFRRDLLTLRLFATVETTGSYWLNPQLDYALRDALTLRLGGQVFGGPQPDDATALAGLRSAQRLSFATYDANDLVFIQAIYGF